MIGGLLGRKLGMTQIWDDAERLRPATVIEAGPCVVLQVKTEDTDGYNALQLGFDDKPFRRKHGKGERRRAAERRGATRPEIAHARKAGTSPKRFIREVSFDPGSDTVEAGQELTVELFNDIPLVDVIGVTKGKGFQGTVKRHKFSRGPQSHGSMNVRRPGSIGQSASPSRVFPGSRMGGHMGHVCHTEKNLPVLEVQGRRHLLVVGGSVPGPNGSYLIIRPAKRLATRSEA
ncbi:MAG: 50S ribosomal protein L3 [Planctomycetota bacterium]